MATKTKDQDDSTGKRTYEAAYKKHKDKATMRQVSVEFYQWEEEGQVLIGKLLEFEPIMSKEFGKEYNRYIFDTDEGLVGVICGSVVDSLMEEKDLIGKTLAIEYKGKRQLEGGKVVNRFKVSIIPEG